MVFVGKKSPLLQNTNLFVSFTNYFFKSYIDTVSLRRDN